jgi:oligopeptide/dipeptide ABC transporter ATP-binding protein
MMTETSEAAPVLEVADLTVEFRTVNGGITAVNGISFDIRRGEIVSLVGESGSGKSVTALSVLGLVPNPPGRITAGSILFKGENLLQATQKRMRQVRGAGISMVFQEPSNSLNPVYRIFRQIAEQLKWHGAADRRSLLEKTVDLLSQVRIPEPRKRQRDYPHQFSGGMQQRVMIAMGMSCSPDLIIADEPTTALDVTIQAQVLELLRDQTKLNNTSLLLITHNLGVVARYADRVNVMYAGRIVESAPSEELFERPRHPYTLGLLRSVPRIDEDVVEELATIPGQPPDMTEIIAGCAFHPRCRMATDRCRVDPPPLIETSEKTSVACWEVLYAV